VIISRLEESVGTMFLSSPVTSSAVVAATMVGCVALAVLSFLCDDDRNPVLAVLSRGAATFLVPLVAVSGFLAISWLASFLTL
jgi:hypothetical protein